jgi:hypothetical protein
MDKRTQQGQEQSGDKARIANVGNASNPGISDEDAAGIGENQLFDEKAEKYIREVANIEDVPDAEERKDIDE